eukprot:scaffold35055_cov26-Phaeocystis_antarctica.AAC.1
MPPEGASDEGEVIYDELARSGVSSVISVRTSPGRCTVRRQFFGLRRSTAAQIPLISCLSSHAIRWKLRPAERYTRSTSRLVGSPTKCPLLRSEVQLSRDCAGRFGWNLHGTAAWRGAGGTVKVASAGTSVRA